MIYLLSLIFLALPSYLIRFQILGIPTTALEILIYLSALTEIILLRKKLSQSLSLKNLKSLAKKRWMQAFSLLFIALLTSILVAPEKRAALGILKGFFIDPFLVFLMVYQNVKTQKDLLKISLGLSLGAILITLWAILQGLGFYYLLPHQPIEHFFGYQLEKRAFGPFESPNYLGMYLAPLSLFILGIGLFYLKEEKGKEQPRPKIYRYLLSSTLFLSLTALLLSKSYGALLAFFFGFFFLLYHYLKKSSQEKGALFAKIALFLILLALILSLFLTALGGRRIETSFAVRKEIWRAAFSFIKSKPLFGVGLGGFPQAFDKYLWQNYSTLPTWTPWARMHPHNLFLAFWLNLGIMGFLSFLWLLYLFFQELDFENPLSPILASAMFAILVHGLLDTTYWKNDLSIFFFFLLALSLKKLKEDKKVI